MASLALEKGFYRVSGESLVILECFNEDACVGGSIAGQYCAEGYTGPCECRYFSVQTMSGLSSSTSVDQDMLQLCQMVTLALIIQYSSGGGEGGGFML